jgi:hypothetical protein
MKLFIDLNKASGAPSAGVPPKTGDQAAENYKESYNTRNAGVSGDTASYDNPDKGKKWTHEEDESYDTKREGERQARNKKAADRNLVPSEEEAGLKKAIGEDSLDMIKSLTRSFQSAFGLEKFNPTEIEFLQLVKGFSLDEIRAGKAVITGPDRKVFSAWLNARFQKSLADLSGLQ